MARKPVGKVVARKSAGHHKTVGLPFYFKRICTFLEEAEVPPAMMPDLLKARTAMNQVLLLIYGIEAGGVCLGEIPKLPPAF